VLRQLGGQSYTGGLTVEYESRFDRTVWLHTGWRHARATVEELLGSRALSRNAFFMTLRRQAVLLLALTAFYAVVESDILGLVCEEVQ